MGRMIHEADFTMFQSVSDEVQQLAGIEIEFYHFSATDMKNPDGSPGYDALYGEKTCQSSWGMTGRDGVLTQGTPAHPTGLGKPYIIMGIFEHDERNLSATERGAFFDSVTTLWFSKKEFDALKISEPKQGDVVRYRKWWWNVNKMIYDGWIDMSHTNHTLYKMDVTYNTKLMADTKVNDSRLI